MLCYKTYRDIRKNFDAPNFVIIEGIKTMDTKWTHIFSINIQTSEVHYFDKEAEIDSFAQFVLKSVLEDIEVYNSIQRKIKVAEIQKTDMLEKVYKLSNNEDLDFSMVNVRLMIRHIQGLEAALKVVGKEKFGFKENDENEKI